MVHRQRADGEVIVQGNPVSRYLCDLKNGLVRVILDTVAGGAQSLVKMRETDEIVPTLQSEKRE